MSVTVRDSDQGEIPAESGVRDNAVLLLVAHDTTEKTSVSEDARKDYSMRFSTLAWCQGNSGCAGEQILAEGIIGPDSPSRLADFVRKVTKENHEGVRAVCFDSNGGDVEAAIAIGRYLRKNNIDTCFWKTYYKRKGNSEEWYVYRKDPKCYSACVLALVGGLKRNVTSDAIRTHQIRGRSGDIGDSKVQTQIVAINTYLREMGIGEKLTDLMMQTQEAKPLSMQSIKGLKICNLTKPFEAKPEDYGDGDSGAEAFAFDSHWSLDAGDDGIPFAHTEWEEEHAPIKGGMKILTYKGRPLLKVRYDYQRKSDAEEAIDGVFNSFSVTIKSKTHKEQTFDLDAEPWRLTGKAATTTAYIPDTMINALTNGTFIDIDYGAPNSIIHLTPVTILKLHGLKKYIPTVITTK